MSRAPSLLSKAVGDIVPIWYDWSDELRELCPGDIITESHWSTDFGTVAVSGNPYFPTINGPITQCFLNSGDPNETAVINNSILTYPTGVKLTKRFPVLVTEGPWEPGSIPIVMLPDGLPTVTELAAFVGAMPGNSIWVDRTSAYPNGTLYYACPAGTYTADGLTVVNGQLVQWVELHAFNGTGTGVPLSRTLSAVAPLQIDGTDHADMSANRTLSITSVDHTNSGVMLPDDKLKLDNIEAAVTTKTGYILTPDQSTNGVYVLTDPATMPALRRYPRLYHYQDPSGYRVFEYEDAGSVQLVADSYVNVPGSTILETTYGGDGDIYAAQVDDANVYIELELTTQLAELTGGGAGFLQGPYRFVFGATIQKNHSGPNTWSIGHNFIENTALRFGTTFDGNTVPLASVLLVQSGANDGDLMVHVKWTASGATVSAPNCGWKLRIWGSGRYV